jgi:hypothetical protein
MLAFPTYVCQKEKWQKKRKKKGEKDERKEESSAKES